MIFFPDDIGTGGSIELHTSNSTNSQNFTIPSTVQDGDLLVLCQRAGRAGGSTPSAVTPAGYTNFINDTQFTRRVMMHYKVAVLADAGTTPAGMAPGASTNTTHVLVFRGLPTLSPLQNTPTTTDQVYFDLDVAPDQVQATGSATKLPTLVLCWALVLAGGADPAMTPTETGTIDPVTALDSSKFAYKVFTDPNLVDVTCIENGSGSTAGHFFGSVFFQFPAA